MQVSDTRFRVIPAFGLFLRPSLMGFTLFSDFGRVWRRHTGVEMGINRSDRLFLCAAVRE